MLHLGLTFHETIITPAMKTSIKIFSLVCALSFYASISLGQSGCEGLSVPGVHVNPFNMNELILHSFNESETSFFSYPGWRLYDESGVLIAEEQVDFFGIVGHSIHSLNILESIDYNTQSFDGTLELWTDFYDVLECSYDLEIFPWRVDESTDEPYGCIPIGISVQGFSEEDVSLEISITDGNSLSVFEETYTMEAGFFAVDEGAICFDQEQCYYLSVISESDIDNMQYLISPQIEEIYFMYVFDEFGEDEIVLNPYDQGMCEEDCLNDVDNDGICDEDEIPGCSNLDACNFNSEATDLDESCLFSGDPCDDEIPDTLNDVFQEDCECAGLPQAVAEEMDALSVLVYPNPACGLLSIDLGDLAGVQTSVRLYSAAGQLVFEAQSSYATLQINVSDYAHGLYALELSTSNRLVRSQIAVE